MIPMPLFIDLATLTLVINEKAFTSEPLIPLPLSIIITFISFPLFFILSKKHKIKFFLMKREYWILISLVIIFIFYSTMVSGVSLIRAIQLIFFVAPIMFFLRIDCSKLETKFIFYFLFFTTLFFISHILSIASLVDGFHIGKRVFGVYWGYDIYQSLVSYPAVIFLYLALSYFIAFFSNYERKIKNVATLLMFCSIFLLFSAARKISMVEVISLFLISMSYILTVNIVYKKNIGRFFLKKKSIMVIVLNILLGWGVSVYFFSSPLYKRLIQQIDNNNFDGSRLKNWSEGFDFITKDITTFLVGNFPTGSPGHHNYLLDTISRVGVFGLAQIIIIALLAIIFIRKFYIIKKGFDFKGYLITVLFLSLLLQSTVNSALTQPYYLINFFIVFIITLNMNNFRIGKINV